MNSSNSHASLEDNWYHAGQGYVEWEKVKKQGKLYVGRDVKLEGKKNN